MIHQTITTIINGMTTTIEINTEKDGSSKIRLQQMRRQKGDNRPMANFSYDNFLRGQIAANVCMRRIIQANKIGLYYWHHDKEIEAAEYRLDPYARKQTSENVYMNIMDEKPLLGNSMEYSKSMDTNTELSCLSSFLAGSMKDRMVGKYVLVKSNSDGRAISASNHSDMLALPDKSKEESRELYIKQQHQYAHRLIEQRMPQHELEHPEIGFGDDNNSYVIEWQPTPDELQGAPLLVDEPFFADTASGVNDQPAEKPAKKARKPRKAKAAQVVTENAIIESAISESMAAENVIPMAEASLPVKASKTSKAKPRAAKEKNSSAEPKTKGGKSKKPTLTLVP